MNSSLILFIFGLFLIGKTRSVIVETKYGKIAGFRQQTANGFKADNFLGIPYAKPPIGNLRFQNPEAPRPWPNVLKADRFGWECLAPEFLSPTNSSEDCLFMNILRPLKMSSKLPVMFYIHGGGFIIGSANDYHNDVVISRIVEKRFIFVSINYRLGPYGFFTLGNDEVPGNFGLFDQIQALKFLKEIITDFGGDPSRVTIFGESAGGASVSWLTLNEEAKDLFSAAIEMSGSHFDNWANGDKTLKHSKELLAEFGTFERLKSATVEEITNVTNRIMPGITRPDVINFQYWNPRLDGKFVKAKTHEEATKNAPKKPVLIGLDSQENAMFAIARFTTPGKFYPITEEKAANFSQEDFKNGLIHVLKQDGAYGKRADEAINKILAFYEQQKEKYLANKYLNAFVQLFSDLNFNVGSLREAKLKVEAGHQVYFYVFDYLGFPYPLLEGASHGSEVLTIFGKLMGQNEPLDDPAYIKAKNGFLELLTSFAMDGVPKYQNEPIPLVTLEKTPYIHFGGSGINVKDDLWPERLAFWDDMAKEYGFDWVTASWTNQNIRNEL